MKENNLSGVLISDNDYPKRVAFTLLGKVTLTFTVVIFKASFSKMNSMV